MRCHNLIFNSRIYIFRISIVFSDSSFSRHCLFIYPIKIPSILHVFNAIKSDGTIDIFYIIDRLKHSVIVFFPNRDINPCLAGGQSLKLKDKLLASFRNLSIHCLVCPEICCCDGRHFPVNTVPFTACVRKVFRDDPARGRACNSGGSIRN